MSDPPRPDPERLLEHREFVRGLALNLVGDEHAADDLVQETWLAAMRNAPARPRSLRAWLARVVSNLAFRAARGEVRRRRRELRAARPDREPGAADVVARVAVEREVVDAVMALDEPYRTTLLLRYYDDLAPRDIARQTGANGATVRTRLKRGLDMLRARLDAAKGSRRTWMLALIPLLVPSRAAAASAATTTGGIALMSSKTKAVAAAVVLAAATAGVWYLASPAGGGAAGPRAVPPRASGQARASEFPPDDERAADHVSLPRISIPVRVEDLRGDPIEGATVECVAALHTKFNLGMPMWHHVFERARGRAVLARAVSGPDGVAQFERPTESSSLFLAAKPGYARGTSSKLALYGPRDGREITIRLDRAHSLEGRVVDGGGKPWTGAVVMAASPRTAWQVEWHEVPARTTSGPDGRYRFDSLPARDTALWAALPGGIPFHVCTLRFPSVASFDIVLERGGVLRGRVTRKDTGAPLAGAVVRAQGYYPHRAEARTGADGRYRIDTLPPTELAYVTVSLAGYYQVHPRKPRANGPASMQASMQVPLGPGREHTHDMAMLAAPVLRGRVTGPDGPLAHAIIQGVAERGPMGMEYVRATTDADGHYELRLAPGRHRLEVASRWLHFPGHRYLPKLERATGKEPWIVDMPEEGEVVRDIALVWNPIVVGTGTIAGRVETADGKPVPGAKVLHMDSVLTDEDGRFRLDRLPAGPTRVRAHKVGFRMSDAVEVRLEEGAAVSGVVIRLEPARRVAGVVRGKSLEGPFVLVARWPKRREGWDQGSRSSAWARLWLLAKRIPLRADGTFVVENPLTEGKTFVRAGALNAAPSAPREILPHTERVQLEVQAGASISGYAVDKRTRTPVAGAAIRLKSLDEKNPYPYYSGFTDADNTVVAVTDGEGRFTARHLLGAFRVKAAARGYLDRVLSIQAGDSGVRLELEPEGRIEGVVVFEDGSPAPKLKVRAHDLDGTSSSRIATTGPDGRFLATQLSPGRYRLTIGGLTARTMTTPPIEAGATGVRLTVARAGPGEGQRWPQPVEGGGVIRGRIVDLSGRPLAGYNVWARHETKLEENFLGRSVRSGKEGSFVLAGLADGTYHVRASAPGLLHFVERRGVTLGTSDIEFVFGAVEGIVRDQDGAPLAGRRIVAKPQEESGNGRETIIGKGGHFRIEGLVPGKYLLAIRSDQGKNYILGPEPVVEAGARDVALTASLGARITIRVVDERGAPVLAARAVAKHGTKSIHGKGDEKGRIELTGLRAGVAYRLTVRKRGLVPHELGVVEAGARGLRAVLRDGLRATGRIVDRKGHPLVNTTLRFVHENGKSSGMTETDGAGGFDIRGLIEGRYTLQAHRMEDGKPVWILCGTLRARDRDVRLQLAR